MPKVGMEEIRKRQVVEATIRCIQKHGLEHLTMKKIAREAQVSTGIIYHYFDNKDHLLLTVLKYVFSKSDTDVSVLVEPITSPQQKMLKHIERMLIVAKENEIFYQILMAYIGQALNNEGVRRIVDKFFSNLMKYIGNYLQEGIEKEGLLIRDVRTLAFLLLAVALGSGILWTVNPTSGDLEETIGLVQEVVTQYLEHQATKPKS